VALAVQTISTLLDRIVNSDDSLEANLAAKN